jgi:hypothetical protein
MHDDVAVVLQHPPAVFKALGADRRALGFQLELLSDFVGDGAGVGAAACGADHEVVGDNRKAADFEQANVGGLFVSAGLEGDARDFEGVDG